MDFDHRTEYKMWTRLMYQYRALNSKRERETVFPVKNIHYYDFAMEIVQEPRPIKKKYYEKLQMGHPNPSLCRVVRNIVSA